MVSHGKYIRLQRSNNINLTEKKSGGDRDVSDTSLSMSLNVILTL